jgi:hypothetical protein
VIKKVSLFLVFMMILSPLRSLASVSDFAYYLDSGDMDLSKRGFEIWFPAYTTKLKITLRNEDTDEILFEKSFPAQPGTTTVYDAYCQGLITFQYIKEDGTPLSQFDQYLITSDYVDNSACSYDNAVEPTEPLPEPDPGDGEDTGGDGGTGGESPTVVDIPGWQDHMDKLEEIKNSIPSAPNWDEVAGEFRDTIVPAIIDDLEDMLGTAPDPPTSPAQPGGLDDRGIEDKEPSMQDPEGLGDSSFTDEDIKNAAPEIPTREDPTGGFDIGNPMDSLPSLPGDGVSFPTPGGTDTDDSGEWGVNTPADNGGGFEFPGAPPNEGSQDVSNPPMPGSTDDGATTGPTPSLPGTVPPMPGGAGTTPPTPGDSGGTAPTPGTGDASPPMPGGDSGSIGGSMYYKQTP